MFSFVWKPFCIVGAFKLVQVARSKCSCSIKDWKCGWQRIWDIAMSKGGTLTSMFTRFFPINFISFPITLVFNIISSQSKLHVELGYIGQGLFLLKPHVIIVWVRGAYLLEVELEVWRIEQHWGKVSAQNLHPWLHPSPGGNLRPTSIQYLLIFGYWVTIISMPELAKHLTLYLENIEHEITNV